MEAALLRPRRSQISPHETVDPGLAFPEYFYFDLWRRANGRHPGRFCARNSQPYSQPGGTDAHYHRNSSNANPAGHIYAASAPDRAAGRP